MKTPRISRDGSVDIQSIAEMSTPELVGWLRTRLHGKDLEISFGDKSYDSPHYLIAILYPQLSRNVRADVETAIVSFLSELAADPSSEWFGPAGAELLMLVDPVLVNSTQRQTAIDVLLNLANLLTAKREPNLHLKSLQGLLAMQHRADAAFWKAQYKKGGEHYAATAIRGLGLIDLSIAVEWITRLHWSEAIEAAIIAILPAWLEEYGTAKVILRLEENFSRFDSRTISAIARFLKEEGVELLPLLDSSRETAPKSQRVSGGGSIRLYSTFSTEDLVKVCIDSRGDGAWAEFIRRFSPVISRVVLRVARGWSEPTPNLVDDLIQETFLKLCVDDCKLLRSYQPKQSDSFFGFLKAVTSSVVLDHFKNLSAERNKFATAEQDSPSDSIIDDDTTSAVVQNIGRVFHNAPKFRLIYYLYYRHCMTERQIASIPYIGLDTKGVETVIRRLNRVVQRHISDELSVQAARRIRHDATEHSSD